MDGAFKAEKTKTTCPYCGVGCGVIATRHADGLVTVEGDPEHPANFGRLCSKGFALAETIGLEDRLLYPEINGARADWEQALDLVADTFSRTIADHGPNSVAFYVSGQLLTEDYYVANKLMKGFIGSANIDTNSRLCMASTVAGHNRAFGEDIVPGCYEDLERADLIVLVGSNLAWCHPVLFQRIMAAREKRPNMRLVVIDPRRTVTADAADLYLPIAADGDVALFNGLLRHLYLEGVLDSAYIAQHSTGFQETLETVLATDPLLLPAQTGLDADAIGLFFKWVTKTEKTVTVFSQGVNQSTSGTDKVNAIINTHLATGRIGKPGMGPFSVTGQPNAMGGREVGGLANQLAAHMKIEDPVHRQIVQGFWKSPAMPEVAGLKALDMFRAVADGRIKAIWIVATNPVDSLPKSWAVEEALRNCPFVVVSDNIRITDTSRYAHVLLPATGWGEKDGTVTNSERRISRQRAFVAAAGEARHDWWALAAVAKRMGWGDDFDYTTPSEIYREHAALSGFQNQGQRAFDISLHAELGDLAYDHLQPVQWTVRAGLLDASRSGSVGVPFVADKKVAFMPVVPPKLKTCCCFDGLMMNTGRVRDHWHTMTRTGKAPTLSSHYAEPFVALHPDDASRSGILEASLVSVAGAGDEIIVRALITDRQSPGSCFIPMHWTDQLSSTGRVGRIIDCEADPYSGQPGLKNTRVKVRPFKAAWYGFAILATKPTFIEPRYWALARAEHGWRLELAGDKQPLDWLNFAASLIGTERNAPGWSVYMDRGQGHHRFAHSVDGRITGALFISPEPVMVSRTWAALQLAEVSKTGCSILAGRGGADQPDPGPTVCACFSVGANQIMAAMREKGCQSVEDIGIALGAGTNCGSCKTEIRNIIDREDFHIPSL